jgi:hypothetical protein
LTKSGDVASLRLCFASLKVNERYRDITPTKVTEPLAATLPEGSKLAQSLFLPCLHEMV